jgi:hypothetical protein
MHRRNATKGGWDALPLAANKLAAANLWSSPQAAERWLAKNTPEPYRDY